MAGHVVADGTHVARVAETLAEPDLARLRWVATGLSVCSDQVGRTLVAAWSRSHTSRCEVAGTKNVARPTRTRASYRRETLTDRAALAPPEAGLATAAST